MEWMIWSNEHGAWWRPNKWGYTNVFSEAGKYSEKEMKEILEQANQVEYGGGNPPEVGVLVADWAVHWK